MIIIAILAVLFYLLCGGLLLQKILFPNSFVARQPRHRLLSTGLLAMLLHAWLVYRGLFTPEGINVGFFIILSLVGWLVSLLLLLVTVRQRVESLGVFVFPFAALMVLLQMLDLEGPVLKQLGGGLQFHIIASIIAYSLLSVAAVQAVLLYIQDSHLHNKHPGGFIRTLPPLETMENLLFRMIGLGFIVLSISLLSGLFYLEDILGQHMVHKTVLSVIAWVLFAVLLFGRWRFGWRGRTAIRWTISGFVMLMLAYFGSKFVIELVLHY